MLIGGPIDRQPLGCWAIERKLAVGLDGWCVPLAVTEVEAWKGLEGELQAGRSFRSALLPVLTEGEVLKSRAG